MIFQKQEEERALVQYGSTEGMARQLGRKSTGAALRKEANWLSYIQVRHTIELGLLICFVCSLHILILKSELFYTLNRLSQSMTPGSKILSPY